MGIFGNAFKMPQRLSVTEEEKRFILKACEKIKAKKMSEIAIFFAESTVPFHNLASQLVIFGLPFLNFIFKREDIDKLINILQKPSALEFFKSNLK